MTMKTSKFLLLLYYIAAFRLCLVDAQSSSRNEGSGNCSTPCVQSEEFCGNTNECFPYSCNNWYLFGPPEYTGHASGSPILILTEGQEDKLFVPDLNFTPSDQPAPLECQADMNDKRSTGIIYGCSRWHCTGDGCTGYDTPGYGTTGLDQEFTRRCEAINGKNRYVCYDLVGATNLQSFRNAAENFDLSCPLNEIANSTDPHYIYQVTLESPRLIDMAGQSSMTFNSSLVEIAMHSYVEDVVGSIDNGSSGNHLVGMVSLLPITATTMIGVFFLECFV